MEAAILWTGEFTGKLPLINTWHAACVIKGRGRIYETPAFKKQKRDIAVSLPHVRELFTCRMDLELHIGLWSGTDTDAPIKGIMDCLEDAGIIKNDKQIRDITIRRLYHKRGAPDTLCVILKEFSDADRRGG